MFIFRLAKEQAAEGKADKHLEKMEGVIKLMTKSNKKARIHFYHFILCPLGLLLPMAQELRSKGVGFDTQPEQRVEAAQNL